MYKGLHPCTYHRSTCTGEWTPCGNIYKLLHPCTYQYLALLHSSLPDQMCPNFFLVVSTVSQFLFACPTNVSQTHVQCIHNVSRISMHSPLLAISLILVDGDVYQLPNCTARHTCTTVFPKCIHNASPSPQRQCIPVPLDASNPEDCYTIHVLTTCGFQVLGLSGPQVPVGVDAPAAGMHWKGGVSPPPPLQAPRPTPSHCPPNINCQLQWHL